MVNVTRYQTGFFDHIVALHESQESSLARTLQPDMLPLIGYVAYEGSVMIAAGFLRTVEGGYGQIDTLVTNGNCTSSMRHEGVSKIVDSIIQKAKSMKLHGLICLTSDEGVLKRAYELGFHNTAQTAIGLNLH